MLQNKTISLGTWGRIITDLKELQKDSDLEEFRKILMKNFNENDLKIIREICEIVVDMRNKIAHSEVLSIKQVQLKRIVLFLF